MTDDTLSECCAYNQEQHVVHLYIEQKYYLIAIPKHLYRLYNTTNLRETIQTNIQVMMARRPRTSLAYCTNTGGRTHTQNVSVNVKEKCRRRLTYPIGRASDTHISPAAVSAITKYSTFVQRTQIVFCIKCTKHFFFNLFGHLSLDRTIATIFVKILFFFLVQTLFFSHNLCTNNIKY